jgi:crotonobetainyl-CoA:carnitine CoA-transferase CaiB-like acyl-CoA transferase
MERHDLVDDKRLSTNASRVKHMELLDRIVEEWTLERKLG